MAYACVALSSMSWTASPSNALERKKVGAGGITLLEFAPSFADANWCERSHIGLVLEGVLTLEFADAAETFTAGDAFVVERGTRHRASNRGSEPTVVFIVSESKL